MKFAEKELYDWLTCVISGATTFGVILLGIMTLNTMTPKDNGKLTIIMMLYIMICRIMTVSIIQTNCTQPNDIQQGTQDYQTLDS